MAFDINKLNKNSKEFLIITKVSIEDYFNKVIVPDMPWYFDNTKVDFEFKPTTKCPLHSEDTASFRNYWNGSGKETYSSFYCFGCGKGGTVINLHRYYVEASNSRSITHEQAVKDLWELFSDKLGSKVNLSGYSTNNKKIVSVGTLQKIEQNKADQFELERYCHKLENQLQLEENLTLDIKKELYRAIDDAIRLTRESIVYAKDALNYVKDVSYKNNLVL